MISFLAYILIAFIMARVIMLKDPYERLIAFVLFTVVFAAYLVVLYTQTGFLDFIGILILIGFLCLYIMRGGLKDFDAVFGLNMKNDDE